MSHLEMAALGIMALCAAILVVIMIKLEMDDRDYSQPLILPPAPELYEPRHSTEGQTTRLKPPPMHPRN